MIPKRRTKSSDPIGVFDSGVGGLSTLRQLQRLMPRERFVFLADQAHVPYGAKSGPQLCALADRITLFLLNHRCKAIVVACNTATCYAIDHLRQRFSIPFIGTVPAIKPACALSATGVVGILSTPATARSPALRRLIRRFGNGTRVIRIGCPGLEEQVETGGIDHPRTVELISRYVRPLRAAGADLIVLGCTHYPFLRSRIERISGIRTIDGNRAIARRTRDVLAGLDLLSPSGRGNLVCFTTGDAAHFTAVASRLLRRPVRGSAVRI
jgi:glutamate racemase